MTDEQEIIQQAMAARSRWMRRWQQERTVEQRMADFAALQEACFRALTASPDGYRHFLRTNLTSRRTQVIDGKWIPVSAARRAMLP